MIKFRFLIVVLIILTAGVVLQAFKIVNFASIFRSNTNKVIKQAEISVLSSGNIPIQFDQYVILYSSDNEKSNIITDHLRQIFRNTHMPYVLADVNSEKSSQTIREIEVGDTIIIAVDEIDTLSQEDIDYIVNIVSLGADISILLSATHPALAEIAGIQKIDGILSKNPIGITFTEPFFPIMDEMTIDSSFITSSSLNITLSDLVTPIAISSEGIPLIWLNTWGEGSVLYTNSTLFLDKINRGLLLQLLHLNNDYSLSYIHADKIFNINDLPAPIPMGLTDHIYNDYLRDNGKFYREIWWADLLTLKNRYNLAFTGMAIGSYTTSTGNPLPDEPNKNLDTISQFGAMLSSSSGEMGILGYSHSPLLTPGEITNNPALSLYPSLWENVSDMTAGLDKLRDTMDTIFGEIEYYTYASPSNLIGSHTKEAVLNAFPELKVFSGVYTNPNQDEGVFIQELGPDPDIAEVYDIPKFSHGYEITPDVLWTMVNGVAEFGMVNHSISSIELLNPETADALRWGPLFREFENTFQALSQNYPFLEPKTNIDAYNEYIQNENMHFYSKREGNTISIQLENILLPQKFYFRCESPIASIRGGILKPLKRDYLYILEITKVDVTIKVRD
ncbi:MAG: DUF2194 domain-containing protein [Bacteroidetes bacterium]|nr:DUF2194 domain-containing protein [Bacteroidota bacterium]